MKNRGKSKRIKREISVLNAGPPGEVSDESEAKNWRWQPTAWAGMKVTF